MTVLVSDTRIIENSSIGVVVQADSRIVLDRVEISNNANGGFSAQPATGTTLQLTLRDSRIVGNGGTGLSLAPTITGTRTYAVMDRSVVTGNSGGVGVNTQSVGTATLTVDSSVVSDNSFDGVFSSGTNAVIYVRDSVVTRNGLRGLWQQLSGVVNTCGNNLVVLNASVGNATPVACNQ